MSPLFPGLLAGEPLAVEPHIPQRAQLVAVLLSLALLVYVIDLVRRRRLTERDSLLWLGLGLSMAVFAGVKPLLLGVTGLLGAASANSVVFFFGLLFALGLLLRLTVRISELTAHVKDLTQEIALLGQRVEAVEAPRNRGEATRGTDDAAEAGDTEPPAAG